LERMKLDRAFRCVSGRRSQPRGSQFSKPKLAIFVPPGRGSPKKKTQEGEREKGRDRLFLSKPSAPGKVNEQGRKR